jgi:hypothetical protein
MIRVTGPTKGRLGTVRAQGKGERELKLDPGLEPEQERSEQPDPPERPERLVTQVQVEPTHLLVITPDDQIIAERMHVHTRDPLDTRLERPEELLLGEVVQPDIALRGGEEPRLERVERDALDGPLGFAEG